MFSKQLQLNLVGHIQKQVMKRGAHEKGCSWGRERNEREEWGGEQDWNSLYKCMKLSSNKIKPKRNGNNYEIYSGTGSCVYSSDYGFKIF